MSKKTPPTRTVEFKLSAPQASWVGVAGDFNNWNPETLTARKDRRGTWLAAAKMSIGTYEYKFVVDGSWIADPACSRRTTNAYGTENSVIVVK